MNFLDASNQIPNSRCLFSKDDNQLSTNYSNAIVQTSHQESRLSNIPVIAQRSLSRSKSDGDLRNTKVTFLPKRDETESKQKSDLESTKTSNDQEPLQHVSNHGSRSNSESLQVTCSRLPPKKTIFRVKSGKEIYYSRTATSIYKSVAQYFEAQGYVGVFIAQNRDGPVAKHFEGRTFSVVCFNKANHPIVNLSFSLEKMIKGITWERSCPVDSSQVEKTVTNRKQRAIPIRIREAIVVQENENSVALKSWVGAVKQFDPKSNYSSNNFALLFEKENLPREPTSTIIPASNPIQSDRLSNSTIHSPKEKNLLDHICSTTNNGSACNPIDEGQVSHSSTSSKKEECGGLALIPSATGSVCVPIDDRQINHPSILPGEEECWTFASFIQTLEEDQKTAIDMFPEHTVVLQNQLTKEDLSRLTSMGTLSKNPTFTTENGREFYNSKMTITNIYNFFASYFEELDSTGVYIEERSEKFYTEDMEGRAFTGVYFKEKIQPVVKGASTVNVMIKNISWRTVWHPYDSYQDTEKNLKKQKDQEYSKKFHKLLTPKLLDAWGFEGCFVGNVKNFDANSEYATYVLLLYKEKKRKVEDLDVLIGRSRNMQKLKTVADGDCLIHALFGGESSSGQIECPKAHETRARICEEILAYDHSIHPGVEQAILRGGPAHPELQSFNANNQVEKQPQNIVNLALSLSRRGEHLGLEHVELIARLRSLDIVVYNEVTSTEVSLFYSNSQQEPHVISFNGRDHWSKCVFNNTRVDEEKK
jgi:hypothetical protein